jgi:predicted site-specific integrase-resolvase
VQRLRDYASASGLVVAGEVLDIASGLNDKRPKLVRLLADPSVTTIVVEHRDRLTRFGFNYIQTLLQTQGRQVLVINESDSQNELVDDFVAVITSMCARIYGRRNAKQKARRVRDCIEQA